MRKTPVLASLAIHAGAIALLLLLASLPPVGNAVARLPEAIHLFAPRPLAAAGHSGGGGQRSPVPASKGQAPPRAIARVFVPPMAVRLEHPQLPVVQTMLDSPEVSIHAQIGDPLGALGPLSGGPGGPGGIGSSCCGGIGDTPGTGLGRAGPPNYRELGITTEPRVIHSEEPEYSEEARKARYQGTVLLAIEIGANGRVSKVRVLRGLGLGLDERAIEAVEKWVFKPAQAKGRPVAAPAQVSVTFHLL